ncbi:MAG: toxic anion resistance protein [Lachnospiraceae bacterium]|nr:toxic anion resistance protein [Lachnospiraceae bacterium]
MADMNLDSAQQAAQAAQQTVDAANTMAASAAQGLESAISLQFGAPAAPDLGSQAAQVMGGTQAMQFGDAAKKEENILSDAERKQVEEFAKQIDLSNTSAIMEYGGGVQKKMADFSDAALDNVRTKDLGEVGSMLTSVVTELKHFDEEEDKGFLGGLFKKPVKKAEEMKVRYDKAEVNVNKVAEALKTHQVQLLKDVAMLDKMYDANLAYYKELTMYILAGKKKIAQVRDVDLPALEAAAQQSGLPEDAQRAKDLADQLNRFEKKIYDLELTRQISIQTAPQIRMIQSNDTMMAEKIQSTIVNTIPLWKNQMVLTLGIENSAKAAKAQQEVTDMTNKLLQGNADKLQMATLETAKASERGIVDMETLKHTNDTLISTLDEVIKIQAEGRQKRAEAEVELKRMEDELKTKMLEISKQG